MCGDSSREFVGAFDCGANGGYETCTSAAKAARRLRDCVVAEATTYKDSRIAELRTDLGARYHGTNLIQPIQMANASARARITAQLSRDSVGDGLMGLLVRFGSWGIGHSPSGRLLLSLTEKQKSPLDSLWAASGLEIRFKGLLNDSDRGPAPAGSGTTTRRTETGVGAAIHERKSYIDMDAYATRKIHRRCGKGSTQSAQGEAAETANDHRGGAEDLEKGKRSNTEKAAEILPPV
jgi:hypothetical protein